jgi:hypothetical protein
LAQERDGRVKRPHNGHSRESSNVTHTRSHSPQLGFQFKDAEGARPYLDDVEADADETLTLGKEAQESRI